LHIWEGFLLEEKIRVLLEFYNLEIRGLYRGRGAWLCDTDRGLKLFRIYNGSPMHLQWEAMVKDCLRDRGYIYIDGLVANKDGVYLTEDEDGQKYVLYDWYGGKECSTRDREDILRAVAHMAWMHKGMHDISKNSEIYQVFCQTNCYEEMGRRCRELKTIRNYIFKKKQKNAFDRRFMEVWLEFEESGVKAREILSEAGYLKLLEQGLEEQRLCHGDYTQHNILVTEAQMALVRFDQMHMELQIYDLYVFLRKIMEKNRWNGNLGMAMLQTYHRVMPFRGEQLGCLYGMLIFPEKFWKIANRYHNSRKSWMSAQNMDKLNKLIREKNERKLFLSKIEEYYKQF
jgi:CotS family spore coat protein